jgi:hypothetical protein
MNRDPDAEVEGLLGKRELNCAVFRIKVQNLLSERKLAKTSSFGSKLLSERGEATYRIVAEFLFFLIVVEQPTSASKIHGL